MEFSQLVSAFGIDRAVQKDEDIPVRFWARVAPGVGAEQPEVCVRLHLVDGVLDPAKKVGLLLALGRQGR